MSFGDPVAPLLSSSPPCPKNPHWLARVHRWLSANAVPVLAAALFVCFGLQLHLAFIQPINWDEFRFLADIHTHQRGELAIATQTFQVQLFPWLTSIPGEVNQIVTARLVMLLLEAGTVALIFRISRTFFGKPEALFAGLAYLSFSFVLRHGASFRFDPIITFLLMSSLWLLISKPLHFRNMIAVALAIALAAMVTVKSILFLPVLLAAGLWRIVASQNRRKTFLKLAFTAAGSAIFLSILYLLHASSLAGEGFESAKANVTGSYEKTVGQGLILPRLGELLRSLIENPIHWLFLFLGLSTVIQGIMRGPSRSKSLLLASFAFPLAAILFYRNAFPYFYAFMLAPAAIIISLAAHRQEWQRRLVYPGLAMLILASYHYQNSAILVAHNQRQTIATIHEMFPEPVAYIDRASMISSFPQVGLFLSSWGIENYRAANQPIMRTMLIEKAPAFLITNSPVLASAFEQKRNGAERQLFEEDKRVLRENFLHHAGNIYVTGKQLTLVPEAHEVEILVGGRYTIEAGHAVEIDGRSHAPGDVLTLKPRVYDISSPAGLQRARIRWGDHLSRPRDEQVDGPLFGGF